MAVVAHSRGDEADGGLTLHELRAFAALAEELHFGRTARRLGVAQPSLSQTIRRLEARLRVVLFERSSRSVRLTDAGLRLLPLVRALMDDVAAMRAAAAADAASRDSAAPAAGAAPLDGGRLLMAGTPARGLVAERRGRRDATGAPRRCLAAHRDAAARARLAGLLGDVRSRRR